MNWPCRLSISRQPGGGQRSWRCSDCSHRGPDNGLPLPVLGLLLFRSPHLVPVSFLSYKGPLGLGKGPSAWLFSSPLPFPIPTHLPSLCRSPPAGQPPYLRRARLYSCSSPASSRFRLAPKSWKGSWFTASRSCQENKENETAPGKVPGLEKPILPTPKVEKISSDPVKVSVSRNHARRCRNLQQREYCQEPERRIKQGRRPFGGRGCSGKGCTWRKELIPTETLRVEASLL